MIERDGQELQTKRGEVEFRRKLAHQQTTGEVLIPESHSRQEIFDLMRRRMDTTRSDMDTWVGQGVELHPFLEVGAERGQRSLLVANHYGVDGLAVDISFDMLRFAGDIAEEFGLERMPVRVACDAYNLPIRSNSLRFGYAYQTLHHFPDPTPICAEIARVLGGGSSFFVTDEPIASRLREMVRLHHRKGHRLNPIEKVLSKVGLLTVLTKADELEAEHNVLEEEFSLEVWRGALAPFDRLDIVANRRLGLKLSSLDSGLKSSLVKLAGGNIHALCRVAEGAEAPAPPGDLRQLLVCPDCAGEQALSPASGGLDCPTCGRHYPQVDGVQLLFAEELGRKLYPEYH